MDVTPRVLGAQADLWRARLEQQFGAEADVWRAVDLVLPTVAYVGIYLLFGLRPALATASVAAVALFVRRLVRRDKIRSAIFGILGFVVAATLTLATGRAQDFFLVDIAGSAVFAAACGFSVPLRRPLVGVALAWVFGDPTLWRRTPDHQAAYALATLLFCALFSLRLVVWGALWLAGQVVWLGVARLTLGPPLMLTVMAVSWILIRRRTKEVPDQQI
ncbi:MAG TPA: DUF3159 domain-containing protein [Streptosporangiaceae bacterium]